MATMTSKNTQTEAKEDNQAVHVQQNLEDKGMQTERPAPEKSTIQRKSSICIIGDSVVKNTGSHLKIRMSGSSQECLRGDRIHDIKKTEPKNDLLVIQSGGNDLYRIGEATVKEIEAVKTAEGKNLSVTGGRHQTTKGKRPVQATE
ncbi:hypothetical protein E2C01_015828 [Portunus trituberculatus]|uniref:Uncharacterized protein n=1 Tax=Portunus trituberculatus TaxID=210409 RepID=A0A5B7DMI7_PORTR|nr:hypothetical protein [Portunus trituberculatus]